MNDKEILANKPNEEAMYVDHDYDYFDEKGRIWLSTEYCNPYDTTRSIDDIQRIVDLEDELEIHKENTSLIEGLSEYMVKRGISRTGKNSTTEIVRFYEKLEARITDLRDFTDFQRGVITDAEKEVEKKNPKSMCINCEETEVENNLCKCCDWLQKEGKYEVKS